MDKLEQLQRKSIEKMSRLYDDEPTHSKQVTKLALNIFDELNSRLFNYTDFERRYLEYGSLLHDIGYYVSADKHNKHAYDLIVKADMPVFTDVDKSIIGNIARYHRGKIPRKKHDNFESLPDSRTKKLVKALSAIIRIADGLDRSHTDVISKIKIVVDEFDSKVTFVLYSRSITCPAELYGANKKKDLFENHFNVNVDFLIQQY